MISNFGDQRSKIKINSKRSINWSKVWGISPYKVVWFSHIIYCLSDNQRLCKQLPKLIKLQKIYSMLSCLMNVDYNYGQKWPPEGAVVVWCARIRQLSKDFCYRLYIHIPFLTGFKEAKWNWYWAAIFCCQGTQIGWLPTSYVCS